MISRRVLLGAGAALAATTAVAAAAPPHPVGPARALPEALRARLLALMKAGGVPGAGIAVVKDGRPVAVEGLGLASLPFGVPATAQTLFHIGSVGKQFTAATVVALARQGRFALTDPIGKHVAGLPPHFARAPIDALLSHTSGIADYTAIAALDGSQAVDRERFLREAAALPVQFEPGQAFSYSNTGYVLLGYLIAAASGRTYHQAVEAMLLKPAGFLRSRFDDATGIIAGRAEPYMLEDREIRHAPPMEGDYSRWPDGGLLMSPDDAVRWDIGLTRGRPVPPEDHARMTTPQRLSSGRHCGYGLGWFVDRIHGRDIHYHSGSVAGFLAYYLRVPALRLGVMTMVNIDSDAASDTRRWMVEEAAETFAPGSTARSLEEIADGSPELTREMLAMTLRGDTALDRTRFAPEIALLLEAGSEDAGPPSFAARRPDAFTLVEQFAEGDGTVRRYRARFGERTQHFSVAYAPDGLIYRIL